jgi:hypothetical protein
LQQTLISRQAPRHDVPSHPSHFGAVMTQLFSSTRLTLVLAAVLLAASAISPARSRADMPDATSLVDYGFKGFTLGLELGLAVGYLTTGPHWEHDEWKKLVLGAGIGALGGMTTGIIVAVADASSRGVPAGYYLLRDAGYGVLLGATMGSVIGVLLWVNDGSSKDVLMGAAWGGVIGAGAGLLYGIIEASNARPPGRYRDEDDERGFHLGHGVHMLVSPTASIEGPGMAAVVWGPIDL